MLGVYPTAQAVQLAADFGLAVTTQDIAVLSVGGAASITIESLDGGPAKLKVEVTFR